MIKQHGITTTTMPNKLTAVRLPDEDVKYLEAWVERENKKTGPRWTISYLVQRAVRELIERNKR
jgi:Arc/MetJ-type ribon-helix-helix transcriptional regulator